jgi:hypothetical protein
MTSDTAKHSVAVWEQPEIVVTEFRAAFTLLR